MVGVELKRPHNGRISFSVEDSLEELAALADTAGLEVEGGTYQRLDSMNPGTLIGSGKIEELQSYRDELAIDVFLFDDELSPRQQRELEKLLKVKVVDRTALILDIFARHAHTREGQLQVELAQYEYRLPRLTRMWTHLARQAGGRAGGASGGVGVRGPGETQLEVDRREISHRIAHLKGELEKVRAHRARHRKQRQRAGIPVVAIVGYTNAGKSTLLNALAQADVLAANQLFATLDPDHPACRLTQRHRSALQRYGRLYPKAANRPGRGVPGHLGRDHRSGFNSARGRHYPSQRRRTGRYRRRYFGRNRGDACARTGGPQ